MNSPDACRRWLAAPGGTVHLMGVCGVGMAGLAVLLKARGFRVTGCDLARGPLAGWLEARDIPVSTGHAPDHLDGVSAVIRSAAVPMEAPELQRAIERGIPVWRRGEVLAALLEGTCSVAVSGTHGKTTSSAFIAQLLTLAGREPAWCIGGDPVFAPTSGRTSLGVAGAGAGGVCVVEADESDGTVALYEPTMALVTNLEFDHAEHFADQAALDACFRAFLGRTTQAVVWCADDPGLIRLMAESAVREGVRMLSYGEAEGAVWRAVDVHETGAAVDFVVQENGEDRGRFSVPAPGRHNVLNALAALAVCRELGVDLEVLRAAFKDVGLPRRRFERVAERGGVTVISDYAHHPTEIRTVVRTARGYRPRRIRAVFQPHRHSRTRRLGAEFVPAFSGVDELVLLPVYAASERPVPEGRIEDLYRRFRDAGSTPVPKLAGSMRQAWDYLRATAQEGDMVLIIGAGDIDRIAEWAATEPVPACPSLPEGVEREVVLAGRTTLGVGGAADGWAEIDTVERLAACRRWAQDAGVPFHVLGGGSNVLISDLGVRGLTVRLAGSEFEAVRMDGDEVVAGAVTPLARLLAFVDRQALTGLEFLEGIPGTVGGALRMNAGAWGESLTEHVAWIQCLNSDGTVFTVPGDKLKAEYRRCGALLDRVALSAGFRLARGDIERSRAVRRVNAERRAWLKGRRSAGSVFKNPPGDTAGRLIEVAGLKGVSVGGATISEQHANVIVTRAGATASDVKALMDIARQVVEDRFGVSLEQEVVELS